MRVQVLGVLCANVLISVARGDSLLTPCSTDDVECLSKSTSQFLSNTAKGIPEYDIRAIDPLVIDALDYEVQGGSELTFHFKNLKVTGLKNQRFSDFKMDTSKKDVVLTTNADINISGDITLENKKLSKSFTGTFKISGSVAGTATYGYSFKEDDKGVMHYEVGPETITCQVSGEPNVVIGPELIKALNADPEVKEMRQRNTQSLSIRNEILCHITAKSYVTVIHNIRAAAKILPTTSFLKGV